MYNTCFEFLNTLKIVIGQCHVVQIFPIMLCALYTNLMIMCLQDIVRIVIYSLNMPDFLFTDLSYNLLIS